MESDHHQTQFNCLFENWMALQEEDLKQLLEAMDKDVGNDEGLHLLVETCLKHYEEYHENQMVYAPTKAPAFFSPNWCTNFENSHLWIAGCRPSMFIQLVYTLCSSSIESRLLEFLEGVRRGNLGELSTQQLALIDELQHKTIKEEDKLSGQIASLQEVMPDKELVAVANEWSRPSNVSDDDVEILIEAHTLPLSGVMEAADKLRLKTLRELITILTPLQAIELLASAKKIHLSIHNWSKTRDRQAGRD